MDKEEPRSWYQTMSQLIDSASYSYMKKVCQEKMQECTDRYAGSIATQLLERNKKNIMVNNPIVRLMNRFRVLTISNKDESVRQMIEDEYEGDYLRYCQQRTLKFSEHFKEPIEVYTVCQEECEQYQQIPMQQQVPQRSLGSSQKVALQSNML